MRKIEICGVGISRIKLFISWRGYLCKIKIIIVSEPIFCINFENLVVYLVIIEVIRIQVIIPENAAMKKYK